MKKNIINYLVIVFTTTSLVYSASVFALTASEIQEFLTAHNGFRATHGANPVTWSNAIATSAQNFADSCSMLVHSGSSNGENIFVSTAASTTPTTAVTNWYNEVNLYDFNNPGFSSATGHFTQVVWKATTEIGCGIRTNCPTSQSYPFGFNLVCQYSPAGNNTAPGQFAANVQEAVAQPDIEISGNNQTIADGDTSPSTTDHTDFSNTSVAGGTLLRTFTVRNTGAADLTLTGTPFVTVSGANSADFTVTTQPNSPIPANGTTTFTVTFDPSANGQRTATLEILSNDTNESPFNFTIQGTGTITSSSPFNIDSNASAPDALTDGIMIVRYLFGLTGAALITDAIAPDCSICDATGILNRLNALQANFDIDGNGNADALTDGILIVRYLFGLRGATLISGAIANNCTRCDSGSIEDYIASLL